jgi:ATP-dependent RNA helicase DeaD
MNAIDHNRGSSIVATLPTMDSKKVNMTQTGAMIEAENSLELFSDLCISQELKQGISELGYTAPTPFQRGVFSNFVLGKNIVSEGGSNYGKSLAFCLPILSKVDPKSPVLQALIICETKLQSEICIKECKALGRYLNIEVGGSTSLSNEVLPHVAVLPLKDLPTTLNTEGLTTVFFDGLSKDCTDKAISQLSDMLTDMQILIFGKDTFEAFKTHKESLLSDAVFIKNQDQPRIAMPAKHIFHQPKETEPKPRALLAALEVHHPKNALVTCNEIEESELLAKYLARYGYKTLCVADSRNMAQSLRSMLSGSIDVLLCQSSMLDTHSLENVSFMINYDMFDRPSQYEEATQFSKQAPGVERTIVNILTNRELGVLGPIKAQCLIEFTEMPLPSDDEVMTLCAKRILSSLKNEASLVELSQFEALAKKILEQEDSHVAFSFLLRNHFSSKPQEKLAEYRDRRPNRDRERTERPVRAEREQRERPQEDTQDESGISRIYITLGRRDNFHDLASLAQYLSEKSGVDLGHFSGSGMVRDNSAHIEVDSDVAQNIISALNDTLRPGSTEGDEGSKIVCERAKQTPRPSFRRPQQRRRPHFQRRDR